MAKVLFLHKVKYASQWFAANEAFEVEDKDLDALVKDGAVIVEAAKKVVEKPIEVVEEVKEEVKEELVPTAEEISEVKEVKKPTRKRKGK